jgi:hypothetical protein
MSVVHKFKKGPAVAEIYGLDPQKRVVRPLFLSGIAADFPSPADDYAVIRGFIP